MYLRTLLEVVEPAEKSLQRVRRVSEISIFWDFRGCKFYSNFEPFYSNFAIIEPDKSKILPDRMLIIFFQNVFFVSFMYLRTPLEVVENSEKSLQRVRRLSAISIFWDFEEAHFSHISILL